VNGPVGLSPPRIQVLREFESCERSSSEISWVPMDCREGECSRPRVGFLRFFWAKCVPMRAGN
jgi:hypothetical protein